jgi:hypothetical protein
MAYLKSVFSVKIGVTSLTDSIRAGLRSNTYPFSMAVMIPEPVTKS